MTPAMRRARVTFWALLIVAVVAIGTLSRALAAEPGPIAGIVVAASATTLTLLSVLGIAGELVALFLAVILGVPSAGGVYPVQALPGFFRFLDAAALPDRWLPGAYLLQRRQRRVGPRTLVLGAYTIGAVSCGFLAARWTGRRAARPVAEVEPGSDRLAARPAGPVR